jgi:hypothetical protein
MSPNISQAAGNSTAPCDVSESTSMDTAPLDASQAAGNSTAPRDVSESTSMDTAPLDASQAAAGNSTAPRDVFESTSMDTAPLDTFAESSYHGSSSCNFIKQVVVKKGERGRVICAVCAEFPDIVKRYSQNNREPSICSGEGVVKRSRTVSNHISSDYHVECMNAHRMKTLSSALKNKVVPILKAISVQNKDLCNRIGGLIVEVFNDAKSLSLSGFSWPSRIVASEIARDFNYDLPFESYKPSSFDLQYLNPMTHSQLLHTIVQADLPRFRNEIMSSLSGSFRCDASMDRSQKDNEFELLKIIDTNGEEFTRFIGIGYVTEPGALGHFNAIKRGAEDTVGFDIIMHLINHIATDGENKNVGQHNGLWKLIEDERRRLGVTKPLLKSVCAVHSSALAYRDLCKNVNEVDFIIDKLGGLSTYFHVSARRTTEL